MKIRREELLGDEVLAQTGNTNREAQVLDQKIALLEQTNPAIAQRAEALARKAEADVLLADATRQAQISEASSGAQKAAFDARRSEQAYNQEEQMGPERYRRAASEADLAGVRVSSENQRLRALRIAADQAAGPEADLLQMRLRLEELRGDEVQARTAGRTSRTGVEIRALEQQIEQAERTNPALARRADALARQAEADAQRSEGTVQSDIDYAASRARYQGSRADVQERSADDQVAMYRAQYESELARGGAQRALERLRTVQTAKTEQEALMNLNLAFKEIEKMDLGMQGEMKKQAILEKQAQALDLTMLTSKARAGYLEALRDKTIATMEQGSKQQVEGMKRALMMIHTGAEKNNKRLMKLGTELFNANTVGQAAIYTDGGWLSGSSIGFTTTSEGVVDETGNTVKLEDMY